MDTLTKIVPSTFKPSSGVACMYKKYFLKSFWKRFLGFFITLQNYVNTLLDKTEMLMNLKKQNANNWNRILLRNIEYLKKTTTPHPTPEKLKAFQNIVAILKINSIDFDYFICRASRICSRSLLISCAIIVVFSIRIFWNLDLGIEWV